MTFQDHMSAARASLGRGRWDEAHGALDRAEALAGDEAQHAWVAMHRASVAVLRRDAARDLRLFRENVVRRHSPRHVAFAAYYILIDAIDRHDVATLELYLPPFLDAVRATGDPLWDSLAAEVVASYDSLCGDHDAAIERERAALADLDRYEGPDLLLRKVAATNNLAFSCLAANRYEEALQYARTSLALGEQLGRPDALGQILLHAAFASLCTHRYAQAEEYADRAETYVAGTRYERYVHYLRGEIARRRGDLDAAMNHFERLEAIYPEIPDVAQILLSMNVAKFLLPE